MGVERFKVPAGYHHGPVKSSGRPPRHPCESPTPSFPRKRESIRRPQPPIRIQPRPLTLVIPAKAGIHPFL